MANEDEMIKTLEQNVLCALQQFVLLSINRNDRQRE